MTLSPFRLRPLPLAIAGLFASAALAAPGDLDTRFGDNGIATILPEGAFTAFSSALAIDANGRILIAGRGLAFDEVAVCRLLPEGAADTGFGTAGCVDVDVRRFSELTDMFVQPDGGIVLTGITRLAGRSDEDGVVVRLKDDGSLDAGFGSAGVAGTDLTGGENNDGYTKIIRLTDGGMLAGGYTGLVDSDSRIGITRYKADGSLDTGFGTGGVVLRDVHSGALEGVTRLAQQADSKLLVLAISSTSGAAIRTNLLRLNADGSTDTGFGTAGSLRLQPSGIGRDRPESLLVEPDGRIFVASTDDGNRWFISGLDAQGAPLADFGVAGLVTIQLDGLDDIIGFARLPGGDLLVHGNNQFVRLAADGVFEAQDLVPLTDEVFIDNVLLTAGGQPIAEANDPTGERAFAVVRFDPVEVTDGVGFSSTTFSVDEGVSGGGATVTLTRSGDLSATQSFEVSLAPGDTNPATPGDDYADGVIRVDFAEAQDSASFEIPIFDDDLVEADETIAMTLEEIGYGGEPTAIAKAGELSSAILIITDNDEAAAGTIQFSSENFSVAENAGSAAITLTRSGGSAGAFTVQVATGDGSASAGADYTQTSVSVTFADGDSAPKTVQVPILDDGNDEPDETVSLSLSLSEPGSAGRRGKNLGTPTRSTLTIIDDDQPLLPGNIQFAAANVSVAENAGGADIQVTRSGGSAGRLVVRVSTDDGSATAGADYTQTSVDVVFDDGDAATKTVRVPILDDTLDEANETVQLQLSEVQDNPTKALGATTRATLTIIDNDTPPAQDIGVDCCSKGGGAMSPGWLALLIGFGLAGRRRSRRWLAALLAVLSFQASAGEPAQGDWYAGLRAGVGYAGQDGGKLTRDLQAQGHAVTVEVDDSDVAGTLYLGWQAWPQASLEVGLVDLGSYDIQASGSVSGAQGFADDLAGLQQKACTAISLTLRRDIPLSPRLALMTRLGTFAWHNETEMTLDGERHDGERKGLGLTAGLGLNLRLTPHFSLGAGWELYRPDSQGAVNLLSGQIEYRFGQR